MSVVSDLLALGREPEEQESVVGSLLRIGKEQARMMAGPSMQPVTSESQFPASIEVPRDQFGVVDVDALRWASPEEQAAGLAANKQEFRDWAVTPFVPLPKIDREDAQMAARYYATQMPEFIKPFAQKVLPTAFDVTAAIQNFGAGVAEFPTTPLGYALTPLGMAGNAGKMGLSGLFTADALHNAPANVRQVIEGDAYERTMGLLGLGMIPALAAPGVKAWKEVRAGKPLWPNPPTRAELRLQTKAEQAAVDAAERASSQGGPRPFPTQTLPEAREPGDWRTPPPPGSEAPPPIAPPLPPGVNGLDRLRGDNGQKRALRLEQVDELNAQAPEVQALLRQGAEAGTVTGQNWEISLRAARSGAAAGLALPAEGQGSGPAIKAAPEPTVRVSELEQGRQNSERLGNLILARQDVPVDLLKKVRLSEDAPAPDGWERAGDVWRYVGVMGPPKPAAPAKAVAGLTGTDWKAATPNQNKPVGGKYRAVEQQDLLTSFQEGYDQNLQPRDRTRAASQNQIAEIVRSFEPQRLGESYTTDMGSPIVDPAGQVVSGNGRTAALRTLYAAGRGEVYKDWLGANAERFGLNPDAVLAMREPVLVREVADYGGLSKQEFARQSNEQQILGKSEAEAATADAMMLRANPALLGAFLPDESGNVLAASNRGFLNAFIQGTGAQAELLAKDGYNGPALTRRVKNAVLGAVLGPENRTLVGNLIERAEDLNIRGVVNGTMAAAGRLVKLRGTPYDLGATLDQALTDLVRIKQSGETLNDFLGQSSLFADPARTAKSDLLLKALHDAKSGTAVSEMLTRYDQAAREALADQQSGGLFGAAEPPATLQQIIERITSAKAEQQTPRQTDFTEAPKPAGQPPPTMPEPDGPRPQGPAQGGAEPVSSEWRGNGQQYSTEPVPSVQLLEAVDLAKFHDPISTGSLLGAFQKAHKMGLSGREAQSAAWSLYAAGKEAEGGIQTFKDWNVKTKKIESLLREASAGPKALAVGESAKAGPTTRSGPPPASAEEDARETAQPAEVTKAAKQPWEMTKREFAKSEPLSSSQQADERFVSLLLKRGEKGQSGLVTVTWKQMLKAKEETGAMGIEKMNNAAGLISPLIAGKQYAIQPRSGYHSLFHEASVKAAVREGKPVPPEVLADYPDLKPGSHGTQASPPTLGGGELGQGTRPPTPAEADPLHSVFDAMPMELPEAVQLLKVATGVYPRVREKLRALGGQAAGVFKHGQGEGAKSSVELRADIFKLLTPDDEARLRQEAEAYAKVNAEPGDNPRTMAQERYEHLREQALDEAKTKNPMQALKVIWHEIGHWADWMSEKIISGRGNIFGRLGSLKNYLKHTFPIDPTRPAGEKLNPAGLANLREEAAAKVQAEIGPMREIIETIMVEEPIYRELNITPEMVKRLFGMDARETLPELYRWFAEQPAEVKREIVRAAMKGMLDARLKSVSGREQIGTRQVPREVRRREGRMPSREEIEAKFKELFRAEMLKRNLADLKMIKGELAPVIAWWHGTEKMPDYFKRSSEMYADAFSVFANNPAALAAKAPIYSRMLWNYLDRKPEVRGIYDQIQADIKSGKVMGNRVKALRTMFEDDARRSLDLENQRRKITGREFVDNIQYHVDRQFGPVYRLTRGYAREGQVREAIASFLYRATEHERFFGNVNDQVCKQMVRNNLDWVDLGEYLFHRRVIAEPELAAPLGWASKNSLERMAEWQRDLGPERWKVLEDAGSDFRRQYEEHVIRPVGEGRMFTPETQKLLDFRVHYATFAKVKGMPAPGIEELLALQYGASVTPHIYRRIGMLGEIKNPATATMLKGASLISANLRNIAKREIVEMLRVQDPLRLEHGPAKMVWTGKFREPVVVSTSKVGTIVFLDEGKTSAWYVRRNVADAINGGNPHENLAFAAMRQGVGWLKGILTQLNYAFWPVNFVRDMGAWQALLPGASPLAYARVLPRAIAGARQSVARSKPNIYAEAALKRRLLISQSDPRGVWAATDNEFDLNVARMGMAPAAWSKQAAKLGLLVRAWHGYRGVGQTFERVNKIAGMIHLDERYPQMPAWKKNQIVRERAGSPNFLERGASNPYIDMFALFYNPWKEGIRSVVTAAGENPWHFGAMATIGVLMPTVLQAAAVNGWLGEEWKNRYRSVKDYDLTNYLIPPPLWTDKNQGEVAHLRLPLWPPAQVAHGILFRMLTDRGQGITNFAGGQLPGLNPVLTAALAWFNYALGNNPQDLLRGVDILTPDEADVRGIVGAEAMGKWTWNQMGGGIWNRFKNLNLEAPPDTTAEKILGLPIINNALGRWVKISREGQFDKDRADSKEEKIKRSEARLAVRPMLDKLLRNEMLTETERLVLQDPYAKRYLMLEWPELMRARSGILGARLHNAPTRAAKVRILNE